MNKPIKYTTLPSQLIGPHDMRASATFTSTCAHGPMDFAPRSGMVKGSLAGLSSNFLSIFLVPFSSEKVTVAVAVELNLESGVLPYFSSHANRMIKEGFDIFQMPSGIIVSVLSLTCTEIGSLSSL
ncbi:hypothetical protein PpBr36_01290 [Pyricularia pennisetigena]|uniref:hypothetical protein n=1 Tax=Pyricularia pennisetigena TaxID=1578925 RepID=UPI00114E64CE|nr:hypothetical protein PpBr36_01290 [Pyricularia pennisetigena]TLS28473.1 hypothetical protein PpBr36_01290 [Pyricularia pennisetigena]